MGQHLEISSEDAYVTGRAEGETGVTSSGDNTGKNDLKQVIWPRLPWSLLRKQSTKSGPKDDPCRTPEKSPAEEKDEVQYETQSTLALDVSM